MKTNANNPRDFQTAMAKALNMGIQHKDENKRPTGQELAKSMFYSWKTGHGNMLATAYGNGIKWNRMDQY
jgi:hypothetical protein